MNYFRNRYLTLFSAITLVAFTITGCASVPGGNNQEKGSIGGAAIGAIAGAVIGYQKHGVKGALIGATVGGTAGYLIGNALGKYYDKREKAMSKLKENQKSLGMEIQTKITVIDGSEQKDLDAKLKKSKSAKTEKKKTAQDRTYYTTTVKASKGNRVGQFRPGSSTPTENASKGYAQIAQAYKVTGNRNVIIVGHTDSSGSTEFNQRLSEARAKAVAKIFVRNGFPKDKIYYQGAGEALPVESNDSVAGMAQNRRVEITDAATVVGLAKYKETTISKAVKVRAKSRKSKVAKARVGKPAIANTSVASSRHETTTATTIANASNASSILRFNGHKYNVTDLWLSTGEAVDKPKNLYEKALSGISSAVSITEAHAARESAIPDFLSDSIVSEGGIKRMDGSEKGIYSPDDYKIGYYKQPVYSQVGQGYLALIPVGLLKNGWAPHAAELYIYKKYTGRDSKISNKVSGMAQVYKNGDEIFYRWKANETSVGVTGILGMDVKLKNFTAQDVKRTHKEQLNTKVYYLKKGKVFTSNMPLNMKLKKKIIIDVGV